MPVASEPDDLATTPSDGERDLTPSPASLVASARISVVSDVINIPVVWLDRLLVLALELPFDRGETALIHAMSSALEELVPGVRVAIQLLPPEADATSRHRRMPWSEPPKSNERLRSARAFADVPHERWVMLPGARVGALHFGSEDDVFTSDTSPHVQVLDRAAIVVGHALARFEAEERMALMHAELRAAEAQMVQAEKLAALGQIAAGMVHELNNPLTSIAAYTDFLLRRAAVNGAHEEDVERLRRIAESASRMLRFTRDLVSYARPSADVPIAVQLSVVVDRALAFCEHEIVGASVTVERAFDANVGVVRGLPEQLAQVFVNLITNACHAMARVDGADAPAPDPERPASHPQRPARLTISTKQSHGDADSARVVVVVEDSGCGISKENLALVFTPFFTTKPAGRGTGLGLSIVKKIVEGHGGEIRAESDPAAGTRFILTFPVE